MTNNLTDRIDDKYKPKGIIQTSSPQVRAEIRKSVLEKFDADLQEVRKERAWMDQYRNVREYELVVNT